MKIAIDFGHGVPFDTGAEGFLIESTVVREYGATIMNKLIQAGEQVINVTPNNAVSLQDSLQQRVDNANNSKADLFVSCHLNAFDDPAAKGCEVEYISDIGKNYSGNVATEIAALGYINRGVVYRPGLFVLRNTIMPAILLEPFFCTNKSDCDLYNADKLATAVVKGLIGKTVITPVPPPVVVNDKLAKINDLQKLLNEYGFTDKYGNRLVVDNIAGALTKSAAAKCVLSVTTNNTKVIRIIAWLQQRLIDLKFNPGVMDGYFGPNTKAAVIEFQKSKGLLADGIVGQYTWSALLS